MKLTDAMILLLEDGITLELNGRKAFYDGKGEYVVMLSGGKFFTRDSKKAAKAFYEEMPNKKKSTKKKVKKSAAGRKAVKITLDELKEKIDKAIKSHPDYDDDYGFSHYSYRELTPQIEKDLSKVSFDFENFTSKADDVPNGRKEGLLGYQMIGDLPVFGMIAGGDWEYSVYFIFYFDGKKLRAYIPKEGNAWNYDTNMAIGNDDEKDEKFLAKFYGSPPDERGYDVDDADGMWDAEKMKADIKSRIQV